MTEGSAGPGQGRRVESRDPPPAAEELARRLLALEMKGGAAEDLLPAGERVLQRLRDDLARVLGGDGLSALEERAVGLARRRYPFLTNGNTGGSPTRALDDARAAAEREPAEAGEALQWVCAHMIGLLFTFLGEPLTTHLIQLAWPGLAGDADDGERETR